MSTPESPAGPVGATGTTAGGAPTVSSGSTGTTPPKHPTQVPNPNANPVTPDAKAKVWNETKAGAQLQTGYAAMHETFTKTLPGARKSLENLAHRPLGG